MVTFHVPTHSQAADALVFRVPAPAVLFAGSRHGRLVPTLATDLVDHLSDAGFGFLVGCAPGVDAAFRLAVSRNAEARQSSFIACAFARPRPAE